MKPLEDFVEVEGDEGHGLTPETWVAGLACTVGVEVALSAQLPSGSTDRAGSAFLDLPNVTELVSLQTPASQPL